MFFILINYLYFHNYPAKIGCFLQSNYKTFMNFDKIKLNSLIQPFIFVMIINMAYFAKNKECPNKQKL